MPASLISLLNRAARLSQVHANTTTGFTPVPRGTHSEFRCGGRGKSKEALRCRLLSPVLHSTSDKLDCNIFYFAVNYRLGPIHKRTYFQIAQTFGCTVRAQKSGLCRANSLRFVRLLAGRLVGRRGYRSHGRTRMPDPRRLWRSF